MKALMWRDGELVADEEHLLTMTLYFRNELLLLLERTGFTDLEVQAGYTGGEPTGDEEFLVFSGRRPA
jgi:hypothetical protein